MAYQVLYRTYRPARFEEVVGQDYVVKTLKNAIRLNKIAHAYLFCGPRGTGKTSVAKLFAKAINCTNFHEESCDNCANCQAAVNGNHPDIIELDAASNNSVENVRRIVEEVNYAPMLGKYKVYIIDEVHMLSPSAFNALLKTLEEPPSYVVFILATTDPQKILPTILSRCQRYNFSKIRPFEIRKQLMTILQKEGIRYENAAIEEIALLAEGGLRDALSILEQCLSYNSEAVTLEDVESIFGLTTTAQKVALLTKIHQGSVTDVIREVREMYQSGIEMKRLASDLLELIKETLIYADSGSDALLNKLKKIEAQEILRAADPKTLLKDATYLEETLGKDRQNQNFILYLELCLLKMGHGSERKAIPAVQEPVKEEIPVKKEPVPEEIPVKEETPTPAAAPVVNEPVKKEEPEEKELKAGEQNDDLLVSILLGASKEDKINDEIIYNRLDLYSLDTEKRRFYEMLKETKIFASSRDAIIVHGSDMKATNINFQDNNEALYRFINTEFGIDKMVYAVKDSDLPHLVEEYRRAVKEKRKIDVLIRKYQIEHEETTEEKLKRLFGSVRVEE